MTRSDEPILVTTAPQSPREEQRGRERRYLLTMGIRVAIFVLAIILFGIGLRWAAGIAAAASLVLPWIAVIVANGGPAKRLESPSLYREQRREIDSGD